MAIELNHTIVHVRDQAQSAQFFAETLGLGAPERFASFTVVRTHNSVSLDFISTPDEFDRQHYAFSVNEVEFDQILARIKNRGLTFWADPAKSKVNETYTYRNGRGVYFEDPSGHFLEILTWR
ncbi:MAG: VOC family protein [Bdellovibrionales bacterium]